MKSMTVFSKQELLGTTLRAIKEQKLEFSSFVLGFPNPVAPTENFPGGIKDD